MFISNIDSTIESNSLTTYLRELDKEILSDEETQKLFAEYRKGNLKARQTLIEKNLKLVVAIAKKYANMGVQLVDLIQEGNIGLIESVESYDPSKGYMFSTYAYSYIKGKVKTAINSQIHGVTLPIYLIDRINRYKKVFSDLKNELGREPNDLEMSIRMKLPLTAITNIRTAEIEVVSLNDKEKGDKKQKYEFGDTIKADAPSPDEIVINKECLDTLMRTSNLKPREELVIKLRYGLIDDIEYSLNDISEMLNCSKETVRQLQKKGLNKLKRASQRKILPNRELKKTK